MEDGTMDTLYHDDNERVRRKNGRIHKIEDGLLYFEVAESGEHMIIPITRIVRIVKSRGEW